MAYPAINTFEQWIGRRVRNDRTRAIWHMIDNDPNQVVDDSGNGNHLDVVGNVTFQDNGIKFGKQGYLSVTPEFVWENPFDITGDWVLTTNHPQTGTHCLWTTDVPEVNATHTFTQAEWTVEVPEESTGEMRFHYYTSTEAGYDFFKIYVDGVEVLKKSGENPWTQFTHTLEAGTHTFMVEFHKDGADKAGENACFIDNLQFFIDETMVESDDFTALLQGANPLGDFVSPAGFTVGGFFKATATDMIANFSTFVTTRTGSGSPIFHLGLYQGGIDCRIYRPGSATPFVDYTWKPTNLAVNKLHFLGLAVFMDPIDTLVYLVLDDRVQLIYSGTLKPTLSTTNALEFGARNNTEKFDGYMTEWFMETAYPPEGLGNGLVPWATKTLNIIDDVRLNNIDFTSTPGQITLEEDATEGTYTSNILDLGNPFPVLGKLEIDGDIPYGLTEVTAETRTSADGINFSPFIAIDSEGRIQSPNYKFIQVRFTLKSNDGGFTNPMISTVGFEDYSADAVINQLKVIPEVRDNKNRRVAFLNKLVSLHLRDANNGDEILEFSMVFDEKAEQLVNEYKVLIPENEFYIRRIEDDDGDGKVIRHYYCEAAWYDLAIKPKIDKFSFPNSYPEAPLKRAVLGTGWTVKHIDPGFELRDMVLEEGTKRNPLQLARGVQEIWGGDLVFDNVNKTLSLYNRNIDTGFAIRKRKNMKRIKRVIDTTGLITRIFPKGANGLSVATANNGSEYVDDVTWFTERGFEPVIREAEWEDNRFYNAYHLLEKAKERVAKSGRPVVSYEVEIQDISAMPRFAHEIPQLRTQALMDDEDLNTKERLKIVSRDLDLLRPWLSKVELSTRIKELGDEGAALAQEAEGRLEDVDAVDKTEMAELMVFNYLQNSRADNGFNHWVQNGNVVIDNLNGVAGKNSFKLTGSSTGKQELVQTFWPSTRDHYTLSAQIATESLQKFASAKVGIKVTIHYEDDSQPEEIWLEL